MKNPATSLRRSYVLFAVALAVAIALGAVFIANAKGDVERAQRAEKVETVVAPVKLEPARQTAEKTPSKPSQAVDPVVAPTAPNNTPAPAKSSPAESPRKSKPTKQEQPERIPFTNKDVTPGDPASYEGTYGQCPFYENAMSGKGCTPPPDIECNADWSVCTYKGN